MLRGLPPPGGPGMMRQLHGWLSRWSWGQSSAAEVVTSASHWMEDHPNIAPRNIDERVRRLARCYSNINKAERVVEAIAPIGYMPALVPVTRSSISLFLSPFQFFHWLKEASPSKFQNHLGANPEGMERWWASLQSSRPGRAMWAAHPWLRDRTPSDLK